MNMDLVLLGILNAVLLVLLIVAFRLIRAGSRSGGDRPVVGEHDGPTGATPNALLNGAAPAPQVGDSALPSGSAVPNESAVTSDAVIDLRDERDLDGGSLAPVMPVYSDPVFAEDGTPLPEGAFEAPDRRGGQAQPASPGPTEPAPTPPPFGSPTSLKGLTRSAIVVDSSLNGSGPTPVELLFSIVETLNGIGFELTKNTPDYGLLVDHEGNTASIELTKRATGTDRVAIAIDSSRAVEALAVLEIWHRSRLGSTDRVRLSARIR